MEIAVETQTPVARWWTESDAVIATTLEILKERADKINAARKG